MTTTLFQDVMQVCRNGHVVTDQARSNPDQCRYHCEMCGATTLQTCLTCGKELPGALVVPGMQPMGTRTPPAFCPTCGAAFPWHQPSETADATTATLERFLRRLPVVIRQMRERHGSRPSFRVDDEHDLADLARALLPLHFDRIHPRSRTPRYAVNTRTDLLVVPDRHVLTFKVASRELTQVLIEKHWEEDRAYYRKGECRVLWLFVFDPLTYLREPRKLEAMWSERGELDVRCVIG